MRHEDVGHAGHRNATRGRLALAIGLLTCVLTALAPAVAGAESKIGVTSGFPSPVLLGAPGLSGTVAVRNDNTAPENTTTICAGQAECGAIDGITLLPSCSATSGNTCSLAGTDVGVFTIAATATGSGTGCPGRAFTVTSGFDTVGTVRFKPTTGPLVLPLGSSCTITFTFTVNHMPVDAVVGTPGLQTRQRIVAAAISDTDEFASTGGSGLVTVGLPAPAVSDTDPDSPANDNAPEIKGAASTAADFVSIYPTATCAGTPVNGEATDFNAGGITVNVVSDFTTIFSATVTDGGGGVSACSASTISYVEDSTPPDVPAMTDTDPDSPSPDNSPLIKGTAMAGSTVKLYTNATCSTAVAASGTPAQFAAGLQVSVASDSTTTFHATATDAAQNASACSAGRTYVEDSTPPLAPAPSGTNPASPANDNAPRVTGSAPAGTTVTLYTTPDCSGAAAGAGSAGAFASAGIEVTVLDNSTTTFYARATDPAGNVSPCSAGTSYVEDSIAPDMAVVSGRSVASPGNQNALRITGSAPAGTTVRLYTNASCTSAVAATGSAATFATSGLEVTVPDNTTTTFFARAFDAAENPSACSTTSVTYVEDSSGPQTNIDGGPSGSGAAGTATFTFSSTDPGVTFECRIDSGEFRPCTSPFTTPALSAGPHTFEVRARDSLGNVTSTVRSFTIAGAAPPPPAPVAPPPGPGPTARPQPGCAGITGRAFVGTAGRNIRNGVATTDIMFGLGGNDSLRGLAGLDCLYGGAGNDALSGGSGADRLFGESGNDRLDGLAGNDRLSGSSGADRLDGGTGNDILTAGAGSDRLIDRRGTDHFSGGAGNDRIDARDSTAADRRKRDRILCGPGNDRVLADPRDNVARDCEKRNVIRRSLR